MEREDYLDVTRLEVTAFIAYAKAHTDSAYDEVMTNFNALDAEAQADLLPDEEPYTDDVIANFFLDKPVVLSNY